MGRPAMVSALIAAGADPLAKHPGTGGTPLTFAQEGRKRTEGSAQPYYEVIKFLTAMESRIAETMKPKKAAPRPRRKGLRKYAY